MASRSPSRRSTSLSHSRGSSHRSPSFGLRGNSRRGRSPPVESRRRKVMPRSGGQRSSEATMRAQRGTEFRSSQRSIPPAGYQQSHFSPGPSQQGNHSPRRTSVSKRRSFTPPISTMPSASGKRKRIQRMRSSSSSSPSPHSSQRISLPLPPMKMKKMSVERMPPSREPVMTAVRKPSRSKSTLTERGPMPRGANPFGARAGSDELKKEPKGSSYAGSRLHSRVSGQLPSLPRQVENPQKRFQAGVIRHYSDEEDDDRPIYRGPDGKGPTFDQHELKKITVGIHRSIPANELQINRQIFNPEDVVVVRRPDGRITGDADGNQGEIFRLVNVRTDWGEVVQALSKIHPWEVDETTASFVKINGYTSEGAKPIFDRDELRHTPRSSDEVELKYQERGNVMPQLYIPAREERSRMMGSQQPIEQRVVAIIDHKPLLPSTLQQTVRSQVRRSRSPIASVSHMGTSRLESISPTPMVMEKPRSHYEVSPPRMSGAYGSSTTRHTWDYEQAGPSHSRSRNTSHDRHKEGRIKFQHNEDLRYELENRRRDDPSYERGSQEFRGDSDEASSDLRMRINEKRTTEHPRMTHYPDDVDEPIGVHSKGERRYAPGHHQMEVMHEQRRRGMESGGHRSGGHLQHEDDVADEYNPRSSIQTKSSSSTLASWDGNPEYVPKGRAYYEHDNRDEWVRINSGPRGARGYYFRGNNRGRYFRGGYVPRGRGRGRARGRGQHMGHINRGYTRGGSGIRRPGTSASAMGGSHSTRGKTSSPSHWTHDLYENLSSDENKPTSTSDSKR